MPSLTPPSITDYPYLIQLDTRWHDNDIYGHVNNVVYYSYFDSAINRYLIEEGGLDIHGGQVIGFVVSSGCDYLQPVAYPESVRVGLRVDKLGNSSVRYGLALFAVDGQAKAVGHVVHVFVERESSKPAAMPDQLRLALAALQVKG